ncbi:MAG: phosphatidylglycerophosphatase A family protein [Candidatus Acidiferrales bacterium]
MSRTADSVAPPPSSSTTPQRRPRLALLIATGFGLGCLPKAPGTWGSLLGLLIAWTLWSVGVPSPFLHPEGFGYSGWQIEPRSLMNLVVLAGLSAIGVQCAARAANFLRERDPPTVVIDEISGQLIALMGGSWVASWTSDAISTETPRLLVLVSPSWKYLLAGFILFRVFDIWKPWPVRQAEKLPGGWGIMADDWVAGIYAALCLWALRAAGM